MQCVMRCDHSSVDEPGVYMDFLLILFIGANNPCRRARPSYIKNRTVKSRRNDMKNIVPNYSPPRASYTIRHSYCLRILLHDTDGNKDPHAGSTCPDTPIQQSRGDSRILGCILKQVNNSIGTGADQGTHGAPGHQFLLTLPSSLHYHPLNLPKIKLSQKMVCEGPNYFVHR